MCLEYGAAGFTYQGRPDHLGKVRCHICDSTEGNDDAEWQTYTPGMTLPTILSSALPREGITQVTETYITGVWQTYDTNEDGVLDITEFANMMQVLKRKEKGQATAGSPVATTTPPRRAHRDEV
jgi:hypothetical protein